MLPVTSHLELKWPETLLKVCSSLELLENGGIDGEFTEVIHSLREDQIRKCLYYVSLG